MVRMLEEIQAFVWGAPALVMILGTGVFLSFRTGFAQLSLLPKAFRNFAEKLRADEKGQGMSSYQSLCTALAATVGTGNIAGVAGAIAIGGPGAVFWMWICAVVGMVIKFAEATLATYYQRKGNDGQYYGGPMYMIRHGMGRRWNWLACTYCFFGVVAACGIGNATQVNAVIDGVNSAILSFGGTRSQITDVLLGTVLAALAGYMLLGGASRIGKIAERLVPVSSVMYILLDFGVLVLCRDRIPYAFASIIGGAFAPDALTGGMVGSAFLALRVGVARGVFTNEAGMGTASISYACTKADHPVQQGLMGIIEVFADTIVICTVTALVVLCSGVVIPYGTDEGAALTCRAFANVYGGWVNVPLALFLACFAFATMLGWGLYGARCAQFLFGEKAWRYFVYLQIVVVSVSSVLKTGTIWLLAEILNGLMAIPNLVALVVLSPVLVRLLKQYKKKSGILDANGGTYESFDQCKPLRTFSYEKVPPACGGSRAAGEKDISPEYRPA